MSKASVKQAPILAYDSCLQKINQFCDYIRTFDDFNDAPIFHKMLREIDDLSLNLPENERGALLQYCLEKTEPEFSKSDIISHGRNKPFGYAGTLASEYP